MADEPNTSSGETEWWVWLTGGIIILAMLAQAAQSTTDFLFQDKSSIDANGSLNGLDSVSNSGSGFVGLDSKSLIESVNYWLGNFSIYESYPRLVIFLAIISFLATLVIIYCLIRQSWIVKQWDEEIELGEPESLVENPRVSETGVAISEVETTVEDSLVTRSSDNTASEAGMLSNTKTEFQKHWDRVVDMAMSEDEVIRRHAIIEADILLDEVLLSLGYEGLTMAAKLQQIRSGDISSIESAWEAHKVRNRIAHEGSSFVLNKNITNQTLALYERVFKETGCIA